MIMTLTETQRDALQALGTGKRRGTDLEQHITALRELSKKHLVSLREDPYLSNCLYWLTPIGKMVHDHALE